MHSPVTSGELRSLIEHDSPGQQVVSVYIDLGSSHFSTPSNRSTLLRSVLDDLHRKILHQSADQEDFEKIEEYLQTANLTHDRALAIFSNSRENWFQAYHLQRRVETQIIINGAPWIQPLVNCSENYRVAILAFDRRYARILRGDLDGVEQVAAIDDETHGQHSTGGWSQARFERSVEVEVDWHLDHSLQTLWTEWQKNSFDLLLVAASQANWPRIRDNLHPYLHERLLGRFDADIQHHTIEELFQLAQPLLKDYLAEHEHEALQKLHDATGRGGGAVGLEETLKALNEKRVGSLYYCDHVQPAGVICPSCNWLGTRGPHCPIDGSDLLAIEDMREYAIEAALRQGAEVHMVAHCPQELTEGIGVLLRF
jgi:hypothetical protein